MMKLPLEMATAWDFDEGRRLMTANVKVTEDMVDDAVGYAVDEWKGSGVIHIYSGVHGDPSGLLQVDDVEFYKTDVANHTQKGSGTLIDPTITVVRMPFDNKVVPIQLKNDIANVSILVILAFCFSRDYVRFHNL